MPDATTSWAAGKVQTIQWQESTDGAHPNLTEMGLCKISVYVGSVTEQVFTYPSLISSYFSLLQIGARPTNLTQHKRLCESLHPVHPKPHDRPIWPIIVSAAPRPANRALITPCSFFSTKLHPVRVTHRAGSHERRHPRPRLLCQV